LIRYTTDGRLAIDNNVAERAIRGIALTRKNFLFLGSDEGGRRAAIFYTVIASAKLNEIDPEAYMANVIDRMAKGHPIYRLAELLPWNWKATRAVTPFEHTCKAWTEQPQRFRLSPIHHRAGLNNAALAFEPIILLEEGHRLRDQPPSLC
jgi:hypothetical protein